LGGQEGDGLQGAAADCNSAGETHAWFDSRVAHHFSDRFEGGEAHKRGAFAPFANLCCDVFFRVGFIAELAFLV
jgi:hypothetical protein